jgi:hypothetical protein
MTKANELHICPCFKTINVLTADFAYTLYRIMSENREEKDVQTKRKKREKVIDVRKDESEKEMCKRNINKKN